MCLNKPVILSEERRCHTKQPKYLVDQSISYRLFSSMSSYTALWTCKYIHTVTPMIHNHKWFHTRMYSAESGAHWTQTQSSTVRWCPKLSTSGNCSGWSICGSHILRPSLGKNIWHILSLSSQFASLRVPLVSRTTIWRSCNEGSGLKWTSEWDGTLHLHWLCRPCAVLYQ